MSFAFRSEEFTARYHVPSYVEWYERCDLRPAYDMHRLVLQVLQRRSRNVHWVLKSPVHVSALPDPARGVPRRAPRDHAPRSAHRARVAHQPGGDAAVGAQRPGRLRRDRPLPRTTCGPRALDDLTTASTDGTLDPAHVHHVHYADFVQDQVGVIDELYRALGTSLTPETADAMRAYLAGRPKDQHGKHEYSFADLGLDPARRTRAVRPLPAALLGARGDRLVRRA